jgi:hypothetical protein
MENGGPSTSSPNENHQNGNQSTEDFDESLVDDPEVQNIWRQICMTLNNNAPSAVDADTNSDQDASIIDDGDGGELEKRYVSFNLLKYTKLKCLVMAGNDVENN